jgi:menaquinone reductase, molybdopterin-binding-like subunit
MKDQNTMRKTFTRRNLLKFAGGSAAGLILSPVPWKLIDDVSIWTQNWSWMPKPIHGPIRQRFTTCSLCPAGCGVRARCVGEQPVSLSGIEGHPLSRGSLCPVGLAGHHLPYHSARVSNPLRLQRGNGVLTSAPVSIEETMKAVGSAIRTLQSDGSNGAVAVLDRRPGRIASLSYRNFLSGLKKAYYIVPSPEASPFGILSEMVSGLPGETGADFEKVRTILSFGAPVLEGWVSPGFSARIMAGRGKDNGAGGIRVIQVETRQSATAAMADSWLPLAPGTEAALALAIAAVLIDKKLIDEAYVRRFASDFEKGAEVSYCKLLERYSPGKAAEITGISEAEIERVARQLASEGPSIVIAGSDPAGGPLGREEALAIAGLNLLLGGMRGSGALQIRPSLPELRLADGRTPAEPVFLSGVPDHSIGVLILDSAEDGSSLPWKALEKKLVPDRPVVIALSAFAAGIAMHADWIVPAPAFMESHEEVLPSHAASAASYSVSFPLLPAPTGTLNALGYVRALAQAGGIPLQGEIDTLGLEDLLKRRAASLYQYGRGEVFSYPKRSSAPVRAFSDAAALWKAMSEGCIWSESATKAPADFQFRLLGRDPGGYARLAAMDKGRLPAPGSQADSFPLVLMPFGWQASSATGQVSPVMGKLFGESNLRPPEGEVRVHPATAAQYGLRNGGPVVVETASAVWRGKALLMNSVMPGVVLAPVGPDPIGLGRPGGSPNILSLCQVDGDSCWRVTRARIREA